MSTGIFGNAGPWFAALLAAVFLPVAAAAAAPATDGVRLGATLEKAFRACALQATRLNYFTDPAEIAGMAAQGIAVSPAVPADYAIGIASDRYGTPSVARLASPDASLWLVGYATPFCKVLIGDTGVGPAARAEFESRFAATTAWTKDPASRVEGALLVQIFTLNAARPGPHMVVKLEGPSEVFNDGRGIQAIMTVALVKPEVK